MTSYRLLAAGVRWSSYLLLLNLLGCSNTAQQTEAENPAGSALISPLNIQPVIIEKSTLQPRALEEVRNGYASLVGKLDDESLIRQLNLRLADVEMLVAEEQLLSDNGSGTSQTHYQRAQKAYQRVLSQYHDEASRAEILYQLSRVYDLQGKRKESALILEELLKEQPDTLHATEAWFRQGEAYFSDGDYASAAGAYEHVLKTDRYDTFYVMAAYMQGWSYYKLEDHNNALTSFDQMLSASFAQSKTGSRGSDYQLPVIDALSKGQQKLVKDSLRVMARLFANQGNGEAAIDFYQASGDKAHSYLVYNELAQQHLDNDRYLDAAEAYLAFASSHVGHPEAVSFYVKHIDVFILGGFPSEVLAAKAGFVDTFGLTNGQYRALSILNRERAAPYLHQYLQELAQAQHSLAQQLSDPKRHSDLPETLQSLSAQALQLQSSRAFAQAADYYLEFIATFPDDEKRAQMQFNLAESYYEAGQYAKAIEQYEDFAYRFGAHPQASDAAYTALLAFKALLNSVSEQEKAGWLQREQSSRDNFINMFSSDARAIAVAQTLMQEQFDQAHYKEALYYSEWLLNPSPVVSQNIAPRIAASAQLVKAHSYFGLQDYPAAEKAYATFLGAMDAATPTFAELERNYAVSIYKQAEQAASRQMLSEAVAHLTRIIEHAPQVDVRVNAQYDAATYLLTLERFGESQQMFEDFARRFPHHELSNTIESKLLYIFEQTEQWQPAADILYRQWQAEGNNNTGREALLAAAEYFAKVGNRAQALPAYRTYAHTFAEPFAVVTEVRFIMSEFYRESKEDSKRRFWLNKLIKGHDGAGASQTARSQTLAAMSAMVFADDTRVAFTAIKLKQPLKANLQRKREALNKAVQAHNKVLSYGVREYATLANHQMGTLYRTLANHLMTSERPKALNALELEQYDLLLEEQAFPFEEQAIRLFESNAKRSWQGIYDEWVKASFAQLQQLLPGRYHKPELVEVINVEHY